MAQVADTMLAGADETDSEHARASTDGAFPCDARDERIRSHMAARATTRAGRLTIRAGTRRDVATIVALIRGLADYEKLSHEVNASLARIRAHGFGRRRYFETL